LTTIDGAFYVMKNDSLISLSGLESLTSIAGPIIIGGGWMDGNPSLVTLSGLDNLDAGTIGNIKIRHNSSLSTCHVQSICDYILAPNGTISIHDNAPGCNSQQEVEEACEDSCLPDGITFTTQEEIDNFETNYPGCIEIEGDVAISGNDIDDLSGLEILIAIGGDLNISSNDLLNNLSGLDSITSIGGNLEIISNPVLSELTGLDNITSIGGNLEIVDNEVITSLYGLESIESESIVDLNITGNSALSECDIWNICQYLNNSSGTVVIENNAPECNSIEEVEEHCLIGIEEFASKEGLNIYPNPLGSDVIISYNLEHSSFVILKILDLSGKEMSILINEVQKQGEQKVKYNSHGLKPGVYFCVIKTNNGMQTKKIIRL